MFKRGTRCLRLMVMVGGLLLAPAMWSAHVNPHALNSSKAKSRKVSESQRTRRRMRHLASGRSTAVRSRATLTRASVSTSHHRYHERFFVSSFADDIAAGDVTAGEDPVVRQAAIDALGNMNGTVVAIEPTSGRVLAMVNQRLALSSGAQPCSTIKLSVALAALNEGLVSKDTEISLGSRSRMNLTEALAHSNNAYFEALGRKLGFEKVAYYAHQYGLGELAGYDIP
ncbi:MAG: penicillin-binding transpeptidase domain-containing protein, partial [Candidatus Sulfotelmatobacter sp.]